MQPDLCMFSQIRPLPRLPMRSDCVPILVPGFCTKDLIRALGRKPNDLHGCLAVHAVSFTDATCFGDPVRIHPCHSQSAS